MKKKPKVEAWAVDVPTYRWVFALEVDADAQVDSLRDSSDTRPITKTRLVEADPAKESVFRAAVRWARWAMRGGLEPTDAAPEDLALTRAVSRATRKAGKK